MGTRRALRALVVIATIAVVLGACSDDEPSEPGATAPSTQATVDPALTEATTTTLDVSGIEASEDFCAAAQVLIDLNEQTTPLMNVIVGASEQTPASGDTALPNAITELNALEPELVDALDALAGTAPPELSEDIAQFRAGSIAVMDAIQEAAASGDVESAMGGIDPAVTTNAVAAIRRVSAVTEDDCGFSLTN
jgi:hypothetical protein